MEQPSKPASEERHDARRHISTQLDLNVRRGAGRKPLVIRHQCPDILHLHAVLLNPAPVSEQALQLSPAPTVHFHRQVAKTPCQDNMTPNPTSLHTLRIYFYLQKQAGLENIPNWVCGESTHRICCSNSGRKSCPANVQQTLPKELHPLLVHNQVAGAVHDHKASNHSLPLSSKHVKRRLFSLRSYSPSVSNVQQTSRIHMLVIVR